MRDYREKQAGALIKKMKTTPEGSPDYKIYEPTATRYLLGKVYPCGTGSMKLLVQSCKVYFFWEREFLSGFFPVPDCAIMLFTEARPIACRVGAFPFSRSANHA
jgi:hypothetical protein